MSDGKEVKASIEVKKEKCKNVEWNENRKRWYAFVFEGRKKMYVGAYKTEQEAVSAYENKIKN